MSSKVVEVLKSNNSGSCFCTVSSWWTKISTESFRKVTPSIEIDTEYTPVSANFGGLHCNVLLSINIPAHDRDGINAAAEGNRLLVGTFGAFNRDGLDQFACLKVNFTMILAECQNPLPKSCSLLKDRRGPTVGNA